MIQYCNAVAVGRYLTTNHKEGSSVDKRPDASPHFTGWPSLLPHRNDITAALMMTRRTCKIRMAVASILHLTAMNAKGGVLSDTFTAF